MELLKPYDLVFLSSVNNPATPRYIRDIERGDRLHYAFAIVKSLQSDELRREVTIELSSTSKYVTFVNMRCYKVISISMSQFNVL